MIASGQERPANLSPILLTSGAVPIGSSQFVSRLRKPPQVGIDPHPRERQFGVIRSGGRSRRKRRVGLFRIDNPGDCPRPHEPHPRFIRPRLSIQVRVSVARPEHPHVPVVPPSVCARLVETRARQCDRQLLSEAPVGKIEPFSGMLGLT